MCVLSFQATIKSVDKPEVHVTDLIYPYITHYLVVSIFFSIIPIKTQYYPIVYLVKGTNCKDLQDSKAGTLNSSTLITSAFPSKFLVALHERPCKRLIIWTRSGLLQAHPKNLSAQTVYDAVLL